MAEKPAEGDGRRQTPAGGRVRAVARQQLVLRKISPHLRVPLGPCPLARGTNGIILRHGYIVAQFGDTKAADPVYSVAKSFLSTVASVAVERGLIKDLNDPVFKYVNDGGYDSEHNRKITWRNHLQQESEWEGTLWGKNANFIGAEQFGAGERKPRAIRSPAHSTVSATMCASTALARCCACSARGS
jgi:CubicO group peptidase (beta-lactamase class C family)